MNTETIYTITAACTLIAAGIVSFPYRLSYGNTSWLPWWMQPDCKYLERPYEYDYPARNINLLFSVSVVAIGILAMLFILTPDLPDDVPAERWFAALAVLYPAYASCQVLFWRKDYGDGFCYAGRITSFSYGKVYTILLAAATTFALYLTNVVTLSVYRGVSMLFCLLCCLFLIHNYIRVFRLRGDNEYSDPIGIKEMYPESLGLPDRNKGNVPRKPRSAGFSASCRPVRGGFMVEPLCLHHWFRRSAVGVHGVTLSVPLSPCNQR